MDSRDFARYLADAVEHNEQGTLRPFAGPEILTIGDVAREFQAAYGISRRIFNIPLPGPIARATRAMFPIAPSNAVRGEPTWREWLSRQQQVDVSSRAANTHPKGDSHARA
jgi:hypothetical protein